jgi:hypothetical protein
MAAGASSGVARAARAVLAFVVFQAAWFACVIGAARGHAALGVAAVAAAVALALAASDRRGADGRLIAAALVLGFGWDSALARTGLVEYAAAWPAGGFAPAWILALWALFAVVLREPPRWLHGRPLLAGAFGAGGGPLSYAAAERLGACRFADAPLAMAVLALGWAVMTPLLIALARRLDAPPGPRP